MTNETVDLEHESLGQFLKTTRTAKGYDIDTVCAETRISRSNLSAMESDDYDTLPADAFAKGFYSIYAKVLGLDSDEIIARFLVERGSTPEGRRQDVHTPPAKKAQKHVGHMAEPSGVSPLSTIGLALLLVIIVGVGVCWHFNINPATLISEKLRGLQDTESTETTPASGEDGSDAEQGKGVDQPNIDNSTSYHQSGGFFLITESTSLIS